jgi:hypothetical protein
MSPHNGYGKFLRSQISLDAECGRFASCKNLVSWAPGINFLPIADAPDKSEPEALAEIFRGAIIG